MTDAWARVVAPMGGMGEATPTGAAMGMAGGVNGAAYMTISNAGDVPDRLLKAESDVAGSVELHTVIDNNGVKEMRPVEAVDVPAKGEVRSSRAASISC